MPSGVRTTWDEEVFTAAVGSDPSGAFLRVTVRRSDASAERFADIDPARFADEGGYEAVVSRTVDALRSALGYVEPEPYAPDEFVIRSYQCREDGARFGALDIEHLPTGRRTPVIDFRTLGGRPIIEARNEAMAALIRELRAAGVPPQPRAERGSHLPGKKFGKPRWAGEAPADGGPRD